MYRRHDGTCEFQCFANEQNWHVARSLGTHMPSVLHEVLRELFAKRPDLLAPLLERRLALPGSKLVALDSELTDPRSRQLLPDAVLAYPNADAPEMIVIVEVHLKIAERKRRVWPQYTATAHGRYACPVVLIVVTPSAAVERWARRPIHVGPAHSMVPEVLGPGGLPLLGPQEVRQAPIVGMLSTLAHVDNPRCAEQALQTLEALASWDDDADGRLADILQAALPVAVRERMEELMRTSKYEYQSDFAKKYFAAGREEGREEGRALGEARALLLVLRSRKLELSVATRRRIEEEQDSARLERWIERAVTAETIEEVFADE